MKHPYLIDFSQLYFRAKDIATAYESQNLVFMVGAGASKSYSADMPNWEELLTSLRKTLKFQSRESAMEIDNLIKRQRFGLAAEAMRRYVKTNKIDEDSGQAVDAEVAKLLKGKLHAAQHTASTSLHLAVLDFNVPVITTNFDTILEDAAKHYEQYYPTFTYEDQVDVENLLDPTQRHDKYIFKLHGSTHKSQRLILDESDYVDFYFYEKWPTTLNWLRHILSSKMVVFVGFSLTDPEIMFVLREATRYAGSFQHIALMRKSSITDTETSVWKTAYKVEPILYETHEDLPLFVMEMRTFFPRQDLALRLRPQEPRIHGAIDLVKQKDEYYFLESSGTVLMGSVAKYYDLTEADVDADVDVLFLTDEPPDSPRATNVDADRVLGRTLDGTVLSRDDFYDLLRSGDPFASSVLVRGCPIEDTDGYFGVLARGFRGDYQADCVIRNADARLGERWLRLCIQHSADSQIYLNACYQWAITAMQRYMFPYDETTYETLLSISLLGNPRYVIARFSELFTNVDQDMFVDLMKAAKGAVDNPARVRIEDIAAQFVLAFRDRIDVEDFRSMFVPGDLFLTGAIETIMAVYKTWTDQLDALSATANEQGYLAIDEEIVFREGWEAEISQHQSIQLTDFDVLFMFRLHEILNDFSAENQEIESIVKRAQEAWVESTSALRKHLDK